MPKYKKSTPRRNEPRRARLVPRRSRRRRPRARGARPTRRRRAEPPRARAAAGRHARLPQQPGTGTAVRRSTDGPRVVVTRDKGDVLPNRAKSKAGIEGRGSPPLPTLAGRRVLAAGSPWALRRVGAGRRPGVNVGLVALTPLRHAHAAPVDPGALLAKRYGITALELVVLFVLGFVLEVRSTRRPYNYWW